MAASELLRVHSVAEAQFYLMVQPCQACGKGPLRLKHHRIAPQGHRVVGRMQTACAACGRPADLTFDMTGAEDLRAEGKDALVRVNPSDEPSQVIDVAGWVSLFAVIADAAARESDRVESRRLGYEAAQCLEEALKFYESDNDLPPAWAFFSDNSRERAQRHPQQYHRQRLIELRGKLPTLTAMETRIKEGSRRRKWWRFWGR